MKKFKPEISTARLFCQAYVTLERKEKDQPSAKRQSFWDKAVASLLKRYEGVQVPMKQEAVTVGSLFIFPDGSFAMANCAHPGKLIVDK